MVLCPKCDCVLKTFEGGYTSDIGTNKVIFSQIKTCSNNQCANFDMPVEIVEHEMN